MNSPPHNQIDNASALVDIEARGNNEARGASSNERIPSDGDNETGDQNPGNDETPLDGVNIIALNDEAPPNDEVHITVPNEDHEGKKELKFVNMLGGQIIATGIAAFSLKNTSNVSSEAKVLRSILLGCMFISLISLFYGLCLYVYKSSSLGAWVVRVIGCAAMALTLLIATGLNLSDKLMLPVTLAACILSFPAIILYAIKIALRRNGDKLWRQNENEYFSISDMIQELEEKSNYQVFICSDANNGTCNGGPFITSNEHKTLDAYTSSIQSLLNLYPEMENLIECRSVKEAFSSKTAIQCKDLCSWCGQDWFISLLLWCFWFQFGPAKCTMINSFTLCMVPRYPILEQVILHI